MGIISQSGRHLLADILTEENQLPRQPEHHSLLDQNALQTRPKHRYILWKKQKAGCKCNINYWEY